MSIWHIILAIAGLGAIGGFLNSALAGEFLLPQVDKITRVWRPGWVGNVIIGGVAAVVVWGVYGPLSSYDLVTSQHQDMHLTVSQLLSSIVVGLGGSKILTQMAQVQADRVTRNSLASSLSSALAQAPSSREVMNNG